MQLPKVYTPGPAYLILYSDHTGVVSEDSEANNTRAIPVTMTRPDLGIDLVTVQSNAAAGELVPLSWTVRNAGTGTSQGQWYTSGTDSYRWYDKVYLSTDATWDASDTFVGEVARVNTPLAAGASYTTAPTLMFPTTIANGDYQLLVITDGNGDVIELNDANNVFARPITIGRGDLVVDAFSAPPTPANGELVAFTYTVRNAGTNTANGTWDTSGTDSYRWYDRV